MQGLAHPGGREQAQALAQLEAALSEAHRQHEAQTPTVRLDTLGYITDWNLGAAELFGYSADEVRGQHVLFLYQDDAEAPAELFLAQDSALMEVQRRKKSGEITVTVQAPAMAPVRLSCTELAGDPHECPAEPGCRPGLRANSQAPTGHASSTPSGLPTLPILRGSPPFRFTP